MRTTLLAAFCCIFLVSCQRSADTFDFIGNNALLIIGSIIALFVFIRWTKNEVGKQKDPMYSHQYFNFSDFNLSSREFYETIQEILKEKEFPDVEADIVPLATGFLSASREYLQIKYKEMVFYVCAAPFGKNFFISYRLGEVGEGCDTVFSRRVFGWQQGKSFYRVDLELMFKKSIEAAVSKAIVQVSETRGIRITNPDQLIPKVV